MARFILDGLDTSKLNEYVNECEKHSDAITSLVKNIVGPATAELDEVMEEIYRATKGAEITPPELEDFLARLCAIQYRTTVKVEQIGILSDVSNQIYKDTYANAIRNAEGTVKDKEAKADLMAQYASLTMDIRTRAYKIGKLKLESAETQGSVLRKIITARIAEYTKADNAF